MWHQKLTSCPVYSVTLLCVLVPLLSLTGSIIYVWHILNMRLFSGVLVKPYFHKLLPVLRVCNHHLWWFHNFKRQKQSNSSHIKEWLRLLNPDSSVKWVSHPGKCAAGRPQMHVLDTWFSILKWTCKKPRWEMLSNKRPVRGPTFTVRKRLNVELYFWSTDP